MNIEKKALSILILVLSIAVAILFVIGPALKKNEQPALEYRVQAGDTCAKIAVTFSVSIKSIIESNHLKSDCSNIYAGQVLFVPQPTPTPIP